MTSSGVVEKAKTADFVIEDNILKGTQDLVDDDRKIGQVILDSFNGNLDHISQIDAETGKQTTYRDMKDRSIRCALWMKKLGIGPNDIIVVSTHNHLDSYIPMIATFFVDAIFSAWSYNIAIHTARRYMKQFTPKLIFACESIADVLAEAAKFENLSVELVVFGRHSSLRTMTDIMSDQVQKDIDNFTVVNLKNPNEVALILLSSGSTGYPKGVMLPGKTILLNIPKTKSSTSLATKGLWYSTLDWISCINLVLMTIATKQIRIIPSLCGVENLYQIVQKYKVDYIVLPPVLMPYVAKSDLIQKYDLKSIKVVYYGGSKSSEDILEAIKRNIPTAFFQNVYGTSEVGTIATSTPACKHIESVGFIRPYCQVKFVDLTSGQSLGPKLHGEVSVKSPAVMVGYYNQPEDTVQAFDGEGWFRTGDIGYYDDTGEIFIVGRIKEIMKYRNHQISPAEIEEILLMHPEVQEAVVVAFPHKDDGDWPVALCKKAPESKVTEDELMKLTSVLEDYKRLRGGIHFTDNFQYTSSGKVARNEMKKIAEALVKKKDLS